MKHETINRVNENSSTKDPFRSSFVLFQLNKTCVPYFLLIERNKRNKERNEEWMSVSFPLFLFFHLIISRVPCK